MMEKVEKRTKREVLEYMLKTYATDEMVVEYATHEIDLLNKKNANKTETESQKLNKELRNIVVEVLTANGGAMRIAEIQNADTRLSLDAGVSNQRLTNILTKLVKDNEVVRTEEKRVAYFSIVK